MSTSPNSLSNDDGSNNQAGITRRSFVKRSSAAAVVTVFALDNFRIEAAAVVSSGGHWEIHMTGTPPATESSALDVTTLQITPHPVTSPLDPRVTTSAVIPATTSKTYPSGVSYTVNWHVPAFSSRTSITAACAPSLFTKTLCSDGSMRYLYSGEAVVFNGTFDISGLWSCGPSCGGAFQANLVNGGPGINITGNPSPPNNLNVAFQDGSFTIPVVFDGTMSVPGYEPTAIAGNGSLTFNVRASVKVTRSNSSLTGKTLVNLGSATYAGQMADVLNDMVKALPIPTLLANPPSEVTVSFGYITYWNIP